MDGETSLHVVDQTEVLAGLFDADHICVKETAESSNVILGRIMVHFDVLTQIWARQVQCVHSPDALYTKTPAGPVATSQSPVI